MATVIVTVNLLKKNKLQKTEKNPNFFKEYT